MTERLFCKGYTWGFFSGSGVYATPEAERSMERLAENGLDWICIPVNCFQETYHSLNVFSMFGRTQTDEEVRFAIHKAKSLGLKVCLKPMVDCLDGVWRARINFPPEDQKLWERWFGSYTRFMCHYARIAEEESCEMLCTGCEMAGMDSQTERCKALIRAVREVFSGLIMHNVNHGDEMRFPWLTDVDVVGVSAYYPCTTPEDSSLGQMKCVWAEKAVMLEQVHKHYGRPVMFAEIGMRNIRGCSMHPWEFRVTPNDTPDETEQADFYEAALSTCFDKPWFAGYFWWDWKAIIPSEEKASENRDFTCYGKKSEQVLRKWYKKDER
ncbi:hypothetical protein SAMN02910447_02530 [Ruminococcus sp. YE71]|uniref:glycoside hydrolase family 113 n=1 Tax=unclassified Ruminococcus TaxID=2608920 RepID=UPI00088E54B3|nr:MULTISPECIES: hypothetical protein [unclassified Ruminococcus]SDA24469.1 hypothetical protein SAMN02910446_02397 [Ruminococcus sp. YE78]SFW42071.1 hypothetical protein SAMN02910447_02530 [Ruminococcus sp. YE71]